ncbi:unnamed protein product [Microthlaspi erraticum]|uniref:Glabrous enhancer-binding protein-like DBD domain-containing protein n=1 Tax=Microthlaspi erraticum TaxID=1685480 RepID=A0A6D2I2Y1_9BRAS|nr:unnamed protein product [Microthlaspi erraticum]
MSDSDRHVNNLKRDVSTDVKSSSEEKSGGGEETKRITMKHVWSDEDEIALLQGLMDYETVNKEVYFADPDALLHMVKRTLSFDVTKCEFFGKLLKLRRTYHPKGRRMVTEEPTFAGPHDRKCYDMANTLWGPKRLHNELDIAHFARRRRQEIQESQESRGMF